MTKDLEIGDEIDASPVGPGRVTGFSERGFPQVNDITVARLRRVDGGIFDPYGTYSRGPQEMEKDTNPIPWARG